MKNNRPTGRGKGGNSDGFKKDARPGGIKRDFTKKDGAGRPARKFDKSDNSRPPRKFDNDDTGRPGRRFDKEDNGRPGRKFDKDNNSRPGRKFDNEEGGRPARKFDKEDNGRPGRKFDKEDNGRPKRTFDKKEGDFKRGGDRQDKPARSFNKDNADRPRRSFDAYGKDLSKRRGDDDDTRSAKSYDKDKKFGNKDVDRKGGKFDKEAGKGRKFDKEDNSKPVRRSKEDDSRPKKFSERNVFREEKQEKAPEDYEQNFITPKEFEKTLEDKPKFAGIKAKQEDTFDKAFPLGAKKVSGPFRKKQEENADEKPAKNRKKKEVAETDDAKEMTLNKYIAHSGTCSRREAAEMVKQGKVKVNGELMLEPGYRVQPYDLVTIAGKKLTPQRNRVYILLNKPKGYITTTDDPEGRDTVMDLVQDSGTDRLFPVGRLDRNTTGLLLLTNDGDLAQKLSHPSYETKKVYQVTLNKPLLKADFEKILAGLTLEDGEVKVDALSYLDEKNELGIEIHSGRNRIVRRIFESLGYEVEKLDRVMYAGLTKKNLPRGKWRLLEEKEVILLKHFKL